MNNRVTRIFAISIPLAMSFVRSAGRMVDKLEFPPARFNFVPQNEGEQAREGQKARQK